MHNIVIGLISFVVRISRCFRTFSKSTRKKIVIVRTVTLKTLETASGPKRSQSATSTTRKKHSASKRTRRFLTSWLIWKRCA